MFIKTKERGGRINFFLCITEHGGNNGNSGKVIEYSVCLGETLNLTGTRWTEILRSSKDFQSVPLEDILNVVEKYVQKHGFRSETVTGLREAVRGARQKSSRGTSNGRQRTDEYTAALRLLGLSPYSSDVDVESAFRKQARRHHPDVGGDPARFRAIVAARNLLLGHDARWDEIA
jgi:hypothetical protein